MPDSNKEKPDNLLSIGRFYGKSTPYFKRLSMLPKGEMILKGYIESIKNAAERNSPYCFFISRDELPNKNVMSVKKEITEKYKALIYLAERLGFSVKNKNDGLFFDNDIVGFILEICAVS
jgi:hypothetical protein